MIRTVAEVHQKIIEDAAVLANQEVNKVDNQIRPNNTSLEKLVQKSRPLIEGSVFRPDQQASKLGGLCLSLDPIVAQTFPQEYVEQIHRIGTKAVKQSLMKNQDMFIGIVLGSARKNQNYFDRFNYE